MPDQIHATELLDHADQLLATEAERQRLAAILRATAEGLHLPADVDPNHIPAAAAAAHDATTNLREQLDRANTGRQQLAQELAEVRDAAHRQKQALDAERAQWQAEIAALRGLIAPYDDEAVITIGLIRKALRDGPQTEPVAPPVRPGSSRRAQELAQGDTVSPGTVSSVIASSNRFARAAAGLPAARDWVSLRTGSGRQYEGERSPACPGDGQPGHRHDIGCVLLDPAAGSRP